MRLWDFFDKFRMDFKEMKKMFTVSMFCRYLIFKNDIKKLVVENVKYLG